MRRRKALFPLSLGTPGIVPRLFNTNNARLPLLAVSHNGPKEGEMHESCQTVDNRQPIW